MLNQTKLVLGTAQFGSRYGISNKKSVIDQFTANTILNAAKIFGIDTLDTAKMYTNSERIIGNSDVRNFKIITKIPSMPDDSYPDEWLTDQFNDSLVNLKLSKLYGLLFHNSAILLSDTGTHLMSAAEKIKNDGLIAKVGVSVYRPVVLEELYSKFKIDLVQLPLNLFDRRFKTSGLIRRLHKDEVIIHIRSIFLQGLLLMS